MVDMKYTCRLCGTCCHEVPGEYVKRIPLYPDEAEILIEIADKEKRAMSILLSVCHDAS